MSEVTSIVKISWFQIIFVGIFISHVWRIFFDNQLSMVLIKLEEIHEKLIRLKVIGPIKIKMNWISIIGMTVLIADIIFTITWGIIYMGTFEYIETITMMVLNSCRIIVLYEYVLLILYIHWMVYIINEQIPERRSCLSTFRDMYLEVIEYLNEVNRSIYSLPVIVAFIAGNVAEIIHVLYNHILFPGEILSYLVLRFTSLVIKLTNILILHITCHVTEKEVNRMSVVLHERSLLERNPRIQRQIKFFLLRRLHEHYHFKLYGIYHINLKNLLRLTNKAIGFLVIQILFRLNKK